MKRSHITMANSTDRLAQNIAGPFYVDASCTDCDLCRSLAPAFFKRDDETGLSFVFRQPVTPVEVAEAEEAKDSCPSESIGSDAAGCASAPPRG